MIANLIKYFRWKRAQKPYEDDSPNLSFVCIKDYKGRFTPGRVYRPFMYSYRRDKATGFVILNNHGRSTILTRGMVKSLFLVIHDKEDNRHGRM